MHESAKRAVRILAGCALAIALVGCGGKGDPAEGDRTTLVMHLMNQPNRVPEEPPPDTRIVQLTLGVADGEVHIEGSPIPLRSSLRLSRAFARRRHDPPGFWLLQTPAESRDILYWTAVDPSAHIRANLPREDEEQPHVGSLVEVPEMYVALRVPFYPAGRLYFLAANGAPAGSYQFGPLPHSPLVRVGEDD